MLKDCVGDLHIIIAFRTLPDHCHQILQVSSPTKYVTE
jgi:hypothetical protein